MFNHVTAHTNVLNLKKMAQFFLSCNPFPSWPSKAKDIDNYSRGIVVGKVVLNRTEALFQGFLSFLPMCVRFKITRKWAYSHIQKMDGVQYHKMYDFCQNDGDVIETEDETPSYESEEDEEQVGY